MLILACLKGLVMQGLVIKVVETVPLLAWFNLFFKCE